MRACWIFLLIGYSFGITQASANKFPESNYKWQIYY